MEIDLRHYMGKILWPHRHAVNLELLLSPFVETIGLQFPLRVPDAEIGHSLPLGRFMSVHEGVVNVQDLRARPLFRMVVKQITRVEMQGIDQVRELRREILDVIAAAHSENDIRPK